MSRPQFHSTDLFILRHAWLSLRDKHMLLAGSTRKLHSSLWRVFFFFFILFLQWQATRDRRGWPPPRSLWPLCRWLGKYCYSSFYHPLPLFLPVDMESTYGDITDSPFYEGEAQPSHADRCAPLGCIVARVGSPIKAPTCAASATVGGRSSPFAAL